MQKICRLARLWTSRSWKSTPPYQPSRKSLIPQGTKIFFHFSANFDVFFLFRYRESARRRSALMKDRPRKPIDEAVFWVEHVLRHKGGDHFKTSALELNYIELYQLDVAAFLLVVFFLALYIPYKVFKFCCCRRKDDRYKSEKKTQ